jgi:hypothetical protein
MIVLVAAGFFVLSLLRAVGTEASPGRHELARQPAKSSANDRNGR